MKYLKMVLALFLTPLILNLNSCGTAAASSLHATANATEHAPKSRVILQKDIPGKEKESWFSKYKWWIVAGVVLIAGGAAAAGGGGSSGGSETPAEQPEDKGNYIVSW